MQRSSRSGALASSESQVRAHNMLARTPFEKHQFLVSRRFPDYWRQHKMEPSDPRISAIREYETELASLPASAFNELYIQAVDEHTREQQEAEERADRLEFFNRPDAAADFRFWSHLEQWSLDDTAALLLAKNPQKVSSTSLYRVRHESPFRRAFEDLSSKLIRAKRDGKLKEHDTPANFIGWAEAVGVPIPPELSGRLEAGGGIQIEGRERASLLKMIFGMATKRYNYNPADPKSPAPTSIVDDLAELGLQMSQETVRKYLREASSLLPANTIKKNSR
jgi:hypothetical protein